MKLQGMDDVLRNLTREVKKIEGRSKAGVLEAGLYVKGETLEITPQDQGVLINSAFVDVEEARDGPVARVGFTAEYSEYVHEMPDTTNWSKPGTGNKFLEKTIRRAGRIILEIIRGKARVR